MSFRVGIGYDLHRMSRDRPLVLGGINIPHGCGLMGHSDGDALLHSIADALLGACAMGDIGRHFPDTDQEYKDADSKSLLNQVVALVLKAGWRPVNVDANIIAQEPKMSPHIESMRGCVSSLLSIPLGSVSIKARTNEGLGAVGNKEAIACQAIVLVESISS